MMNPEEAAAGSAALAGELARELADAQIKLAHAHRLVALGQLVAGVVHEINNPIGSIVSNNEVAIRTLDALRQLLGASQNAGQPLPPKALELVNILAGLAGVDKIACDRISTVVRSLKTLSRAGDPVAQHVSLNDILRDTLKLVECQFKRRIRLETDFGELPSVECVPNLMGQVFLNLLVNAAQAIEGEGVVRVSSRSSGKDVEVAVSDTGSGILPAHRDQVFRIGFTTKPVGVGTGLGLALSRRIVEETHRGRMWFESEAGRGTTFFVQIPVEMAEHPVEPEEGRY